MAKKIEHQYFAPVDGSQAMSIWVMKPQIWIDGAKKSSNPIAKLAVKGEDVLVRVGVAALGMLSASMDLYYNIVWFSIKAVIISSRGIIRVISINEMGHFCPQITVQHLGVHLYKAAYFFRAIFFDAPVLGLVNPKYLVDSYIERDLIKPKTWWESAMEKIEETGEAWLMKAKELKERVREFVLKIPVKASGAVALAAAVSGAAIQLFRMRK